jgi:hypothetical protein
MNMKFLKVTVALLILFICSVATVAPSLTARANEGLVEFKFTGKKAQKLVNILYANNAPFSTAEYYSPEGETLTTVIFTPRTLECQASVHTGDETLQMFSEIFSVRSCTLKNGVEDDTPTFQSIDKSVYFILEKFKGLQGDAAMGRWTVWVDSLTCTIKGLSKKDYSMEKSYECSYVGLSAKN